MTRTLKWTWGKYNGGYKDNNVDSFSEIWTYGKDGDEQYRDMERRALELIKDGYLPEKLEEVH